MNAERLWELARRAGDGAVTEEVHQRGKERLLTTLAAARVLPARRPWLLMAAGVFALALLAVVLMRPWVRAPLTYTVDGVADRGYVAPDAEHATVSFSDGTVLRVEPSARARVADVHARGARILLERGSAHIAVVPRPGAEWRIEAGPYAIEVTGTAFSVSWSPDEQRLRVEMESGSVVVRGALARDGVSVHAGERLIAEGGELRIEAIAAQAREQEESAPSASARAVPLPPPASSSAAVTKSWSQRIAAGEFAVVLREAEARGIGSVLASGALADLVALADAARYMKRADVARRALEAQRNRFAGTREAATAAFLLGRMADEAGAPDRAISLYDAHLAEGGAFATEALGRKMLAEQRAGRLDAARATARLYLQRYPKGAHARAAEQLVASP